MLNYISLQVQKILFISSLFFILLPTLGNSQSFSTTWKTDNIGISSNNTIEIPTASAYYNYSVDWGDGSIETGLTGNAIHTYATVGVYTVQISGVFPRIYFNDSGDKNKILSIEQWGDIVWGSNQFASFKGCSNLIINATDTPNFSASGNFSQMFMGATSLNSDLSHWDMSGATTISAMFQNASSFNQPLNDWNVSNVTSMTSVFKGATNFNQPLNNWDTGNVILMTSMFENAENFNQNLNDWDTSSVTNLNSMFRGAIKFNQPIGNWDVSNVVNMSNLFYDASRFNKSLYNWDTGNVQQMTGIFQGAFRFNQSLANWNIGNVNSLGLMFFNAGLSSNNYDATLIGWNNLPSLQYGVNFNAGSSKYCYAQVARQNLMDTNVHGWTIADQGIANSCPDNINSFLTTWQTTTANEAIIIPTTGGGYNYTIDWGDGTVQTGQTGSVIHAYSNPGTYQIEIRGTFPRIYFNNSGSKEKIQSIDQWGDINWTDMTDAFRGCTNLQVNTVDAPNLSSVSSFVRMFKGCTNFNADLNHWDVSTITDMTGMFFGATNFNGQLDLWDTSSLINVQNMFKNAVNFNQNISNWNVNSVTNMYGMFNNAQVFNQPLNHWNVSNVANMTDMLVGSNLSTENYDNTLIAWDALPFVQNNVTLNVSATYCLSIVEHYSLQNKGWTINDDGKKPFCIGSTDHFVSTWQTNSPNESITIPAAGSGHNYTIDWGDGNVDVGQTGYTTHTYQNTGIYQIEISGIFPQIFFNNTGDKDKIIAIDQWGNGMWNSMANAFRGCTNLIIQATDAPNLINSTTTGGMFWGATSLTGALSHWNMESITYMVDMFNGTVNFNEDISNWNVSNVTDMSGMFNGATSFNQNLGDWNTSSLTHTLFMFHNATSFNGTVGNWNVSLLEEMDGMFKGATSFNQNISNWITSNVREMDQAFSGASSFNQDISQWNTSAVTEMELMFNGATSFDQSLANWNVSNVTDMTDMFLGTGLSTANYDATLIGWNSLPSLQNGVVFNAGNSKYCASEQARQNLMDVNGYNWTIIDGGLETISCDSVAFITLWKTDNNGTSNDNQITIPGIGNYTISWEKTDDLSVNGTATATGSTTLTFPLTGTYRVGITGGLTQVNFSSSGDKAKIIDVEQWGAIVWTSMAQAFRGCTNLSITATDAPNLSGVTDCSFMFFNAKPLGELNHWDVSTITNMESMFRETTSNIDIGNWNVSNVTDMSWMFAASKFNNNINSWDVGNVTNMQGMFYDTSHFNNNIGNWDVGNVITMSEMFAESNFNQDIGQWNTDSVTEMKLMFSDNPNFNQDIGQWNISAVTEMDFMFSNATSFNQSLANWDVTNIVNMLAMFSGTGLSTNNYDATLIGWNSLPSLQSGVVFNAGNSKYCTSEQARQNLMDVNGHGWTITDGGPETISCDSTAFITLWKTDNIGPSNDNQITIPGIGNYTISWEKIDDLNVKGATTATGTRTLTLPSSGTYRVGISGNLEQLYFGNSGDTAKIIDVKQWGAISWTSMERAFMGCNNLVITATDAPNLSGVTNMSYAFRGTGLLGVMNHWDVSSIINMTQLFDVSGFNFDISSWDVSNVTNMSGMFIDGIFNQDISNWDVSNVVNMNYMFYGHSSFNQDLSNWDVGSVTSMSEMFAESNFNQDISNWNVSNVTTMNGMFESSDFNQSLANWDVSSVLNMSNMFRSSGLSTNNYDATLIGWNSLPSLQSGVVFNAGNSEYCISEQARQNLMDVNGHGWTITDGGPETISCDSTVFITLWQTDNIGPSNDNQITIPGIGNYTISWEKIDDLNVKGTTTAIGISTLTLPSSGTYRVGISGNLEQLYFGNSGDTAKIIDVKQWGAISWTSMERAFMGCNNLVITATDAPNLSGVTNMSYAFRGTGLLGVMNHWDVSSIINMTQLFDVSGFNFDISSWDVSNVTNMSGMFIDGIFNQDISNWDVSNVVNMNYMFYGHSSFNQDLSNWDVGSVTSMSEMFAESNFNQDISNWNVSNVTTMNGMFESSDFNQSLANWDVSSVLNMSNMFRSSGLSTTNYDATLIGWNSLPSLQSGVVFNAGNSKYCASEQARQNLMDVNGHGWTITDGGEDVNCGILVSPIAFLQGAALNPFSGEENLMRDDLRTANAIPTTSPYVDGAICDSSVLTTTGTNAIVDWVWVELRDAIDNSIVIDGKSALLTRNGTILDTDGVSTLYFYQFSNNYNLAIEHRNHIGVMTNTAIALSSTTTPIDFTLESNVLGGNLAVILLNNGIHAMYGGDVDANKQIQNADILTIIQLLGATGYDLGDLDMNGQIQNIDLLNMLYPNVGKGQQF